MRKIVIWFAATVTVLVLLFVYPTSTDRRTTGGESSASAGPVAGTPPAGSATVRTYTGSEAQTRWGIVEVAVTVQAGRVTAVTVPEYPQGNPRDEQINAYALPILIKETITAQSAKIDMVSGATVTSDGYLQSLQSALDRAGIR